MAPFSTPVWAGLRWELVRCDCRMPHRESPENLPGVPPKKTSRTAHHVGLGSIPAVPARQRHGRSTPISGPPNSGKLTHRSATPRPDDNVFPYSATALKPAAATAPPDLA